MEVVKRLILAGGEVNRQNQYGATPLYVASMNGHAEVVNILNQAGGEVNSQTQKDSYLNGGYLASDSTPLHVASMTGHLQVVVKLIQAGRAVKN